MKHPWMNNVYRRIYETYVQPALKYNTWRYNHRTDIINAIRVLCIKTPYITVNGKRYQPIDEYSIRALDGIIEDFRVTSSDNYIIMSFKGLEYDDLINKYVNISIDKYRLILPYITDISFDTDNYKTWGRYKKEVIGYLKLLML